MAILSTHLPISAAPTVQSRRPGLIGDPTAYAEGSTRIAPCLGKKTPERVLLDADIREAEKDGRKD
jgi:hypothetical protein